MPAALEVTLPRHAREGGHPWCGTWIRAFAGMTGMGQSFRRLRLRVILPRANAGEQGGYGHERAVAGSPRTAVCAAARRSADGVARGTSGGGPDQSRLDDRPSAP